MSESNNWSNNPTGFKSNKESLSGFEQVGHNTVAVYIVLALVMRMKDTLGLEAMLEYIATYLRTIEKHNPLIQQAASLAISHINVENIYKEAISKK